MDALLGMMTDHLGQQQQQVLALTQAQSAAANQQLPCQLLRVVMVEKEVQACMGSVSCTITLACWPRIRPSAELLQVEQQACASQHNWHAFR